MATKQVNIHPSWKELLDEEFKKPYFQSLSEFVKQEYKSGICYPTASDIFKAFDSCPVEDVKVVILGQDPYINPGQAHGLCFSVPEGQAFPPSLRNVFQEIKNDLGKDVPLHGNLSRWAKQGVLLLNATLTVRAGASASHQGKGWETFTDQAIKALSEKRNGIVFMLWGAYARKKATLINSENHLVLQAPHPSPLSAHRGFFGCNHFSKANEWLNNNGSETVEW